MLERISGLDDWLGSRSGLTLPGFLAIADFVLATEHMALSLGVLPFGLLLLRPLLHHFSHSERAGHPEGHCKKSAQTSDQGKR